MPAFIASRPIGVATRATTGINANWAYVEAPNYSTAFTLSGSISGTTNSPTTFTVTPGPAGTTLQAQTTVYCYEDPTPPSVPILRAVLTFAAGAGPSNPQTFTVTRTADGTSTVSMTNTGGLANTGSPISYTSSAQSAAPFLVVRTSRRSTTLQSAIDGTGAFGSGAGVVSSDTIRVAGGTYAVTSDTALGSMFYATYMGGPNAGVQIASLTIEAENINDKPFLDYSSRTADGITMGVPCTSLTLRGIRLKGRQNQSSGSDTHGVYILTGYPASPSTGPTATLTLDQCELREWSDGILTRSNHNFSTVITSCVFQDNGANSGLYHGIYFSGGASLTVTGSTFRTTVNAVSQPGAGHLIKSRARTTTIRGCLFDPAYGTATCIDVCNGGDVTITGNIINHTFGAAQSGDDNPTIKFGEEQQPRYNVNSPQYNPANTDNFVHDGRTTHSILLAQNTFRRLQPEGGQPFDIIEVDIPTTDYISGSGDQLMTVTQTIRNNIVANDTGTATNFVAAYPSNTAVTYASVNNLGVCSAGDFACVPYVADATYAWAADFTAPTARSDYRRGGVSLTLPSWVPSTTWQWSPITGSRWSDYIVDAGNAVVVAADGPAAGYETYLNCWAYSGPAYSQRRHELYMFGGGHTAGTLNLLTRYLLNTSSPSVDVAEPSTSASVRTAETSSGSYTADAWWGDDGTGIKPIATVSIWTHANRSWSSDSRLCRAI
jgi:hypothetical protein